MKRLILALSLAVCAASTLFAWDVEHDEVAQLTSEFLPREVKATFDFDDFAILMANSHFPDMTEWPFEDENPLVALASQVEGLDADLSSQLA